jgi:hypothetical protein
MSTETIQEMEHRWLMLMEAVDIKSGVRRFERDAKYARDVHALRVQIEERKAAEVSQPKINVDMLRWIDRVQGATTKDGKRLAAETSPAGTATRIKLERARAQVLSGQSLSAETIAATEADLKAAGAELPAVDPTPKHYRPLLPPAVDTTPVLPQPMITY